MLEQQTVLTPAASKMKEEEYIPPVQDVLQQEEGDQDDLQQHDHQVEFIGIEAGDKLDFVLEAVEQTENSNMAKLNCFLCDAEMNWNEDSNVYYKDHLETVHMVSTANINKIINLTLNNEQPHLISRKDSVTEKSSTKAQYTLQPNKNRNAQVHDEFENLNNINDVIAADVDKYINNKVIDHVKHNLDESVEDIEKIAQEVKEIKENKIKSSKSSPKSKKATPSKVKKSSEPVEIIDLEALKSPKGAVSLIKTESIFTCNICDKNLSLASRGKHIRQKHKMKFQDYIKLYGQTTRYHYHKCLICEMNIDWVLATIIKHISTQHNTSLPQYELQFKQEILNQKNCLRTTFACQKCDKTFSSDAELQAHLKRIHCLQKSLEVFQERVGKKSDKKKGNFIWQGKQTNKKKKSVTGLRINHCVNKSLLSGEIKKYVCEKKVEVNVTQMDPVLVIQKMQDYSSSAIITSDRNTNNATLTASTQIRDSNDDIIENTIPKTVRKDGNTSIDDLLDDSSNFDVESIKSSNDNSLEAWDYSGLSKQDLGRCINNVIEEAFKFSELEDIKSPDKEKEIIYRYPFKCCTCDYRSNDKEILKLHVKELHTKVPLIFCCDNVFSTRWDEKCHMKSVHPGDIEGVPCDNNPLKATDDLFDLSDDNKKKNQDKKFKPKNRNKKNAGQNNVDDSTAEKPKKGHKHKRTMSSDKENDKEEKKHQPKMKKKLIRNEIWEVPPDKVMCSTPNENHSNCDKPNFEAEFFMNDNAAIVVSDDDSHDFFKYTAITKKEVHDDLNNEFLTEKDDKSNGEESAASADKSIDEVQMTGDEPSVDIISSEMETSVDDYDPESEELDVGDYKTWANQCSISCEHDSCKYITKNLIDFRMHTLSQHNMLLEQYLNLYPGNDRTEIWSTTVSARCELCQQDILNSQEKLESHMLSSHSMSAYQYFKTYIKLTPAPARQEETTIRYQRPSSSRRSIRSQSFSPATSSGPPSTPRRCQQAQDNQLTE